MGSIPVRTEIEVLPADEPGEPVGLKWQCYCYDGAEVFFLTPDGDVIEEPITNREALKEGMKVSVWGGTWRVKVDEEGELYLDGSRNIALLSFGKDARNCWSSGMVINKRLIDPPKKISIVG